MLTEEQTTKIIETIADELPGFIAAALVDLESGMTLGMYTTRSDFDLSAASAYNSEIVKQKQKVMQALGIQGDLEDMTMTLTDQVHVIKIVSDGSFLYLAASKDGSNLALIRNAIKSHVDELAA
jgi:predicted regulator of Ras-like GTPase activity (Roadblock/LC7/MglB family)